ncbi:preprotein translocase subunit SecY [Blastococcus sp. MG754426]|uniref:preprotein translocase subunit SecY n=1 Tax=unclassified Blastococcus TaxID=2619396 RepID=UPI001EF058B1|nr:MULTISPECIES: preprotein translocase subunit SecY [unclassified Blastococcus]MCF6507113.1 preprotein translocase subunit SecY [Blastococcus sp. MG754426]MCF6511759.1 preprotein translocase subunit SecY [Blastococcus sp. MG754427]MCF6734689.1 preprotein translocase subunit SecY [Blastococcus sp. KM273129]
MLQAFAAAFRTPDLRRKLLFSLAIIAIYRLGAAVPGPGVSVEAINSCLEQAQASDQRDLYSLVNLFSGGALLRLSVFALGIMPYITASIIVQLLVVVIPRFEQLKKEGQSGQAKLTQYTRYLTIALAVLQSTGIIALARSGQLFPNCSEQIIPSESIWTTVVLVIALTAGTALIMWLGELLTEKGIGNGMSVLIFTSIAARIPAEGGSILQTRGGIVFAVVCAFAVVIIGTVVYVEQAQRRIPVQYAKRMVGRRMYGGTSTYLPLKVNQAGVIPVIFASSLLYLPQLVVQLQGTETGGVRQFFETYIIDQSSPVHIAVFFGLIVFFTYFYVSITFNPEERADDMKRYGGFIPGIRPGRPTAEYLQYVLSRITLPGSIYLGVVAVLPNFFLAITQEGQNQNFPFGGVAVLIMVGVGLETVKQIETQLNQRNYEGFLK